MHGGKKKLFFKGAGSALIPFLEVHRLPDFYTYMGRYGDWAGEGRISSSDFFGDGQSLFRCR